MGKCEKRVEMGGIMGVLGVGTGGGSWAVMLGTMVKVIGGHQEDAGIAACSSSCCSTISLLLRTHLRGSTTPCRSRGAGK